MHAINHGISMNIAGGTHHAFSNREAFCILNDQAIASNYLINKGLSKKVLILDLDVHQVMEQQKFLKIINKYLQFHFTEKTIIPSEKRSDFDYGFEDKTDDKEYLKTFPTKYQD